MDTSRLVSLFQPRPALGSLELLVLQSTSFCNLNCDYCYLPDRDQKGAMSLNTIIKAISACFDAHIVQEHFTIVWHAGEPLTLGVDYYEAAINAIHNITPPNISIHHSFQTNGVLIDQRWCAFFKKHAIRLGLSIDGPEEIHDAHRRYRNGKGSHKGAEAAIKTLDKYKIPYHIIAVLTKDAVQQPQVIYNYFLNLGVKTLCFNAEEIEGVHQTSTLLTSDHEQHYRNFFWTLHQLCENDGHAMHIREVHGPTKAILNYKNSTNSLVKPQETVPYKIINIDVAGNFSTFSPELLGQEAAPSESYTLGNIHTTSLRKGLQSSTFKKMNKAITQGINLCKQQCQYFELCGGGSPSNKLAENGSFASTETQYCRLQKKIVLDTAIVQLETGLGIKP